MSFDQLTDVTKKRETIEFTVGKQVVTFFANQLSYIQKMNMTVAMQNAPDLFSSLILAAIVDQDGNYMSVDQLHRLNDETQKKFFEAAKRVNIDLFTPKTEEAKPKAGKKKVKPRR